MVYNGGISNFNCCYSCIKIRMDGAQILHGVNYKVCFTMSPIVFAFGLFILDSGMSAIIHQQLVAMLRGYLRFVYKLD